MTRARSARFILSLSLLAVGIAPSGATAQLSWPPAAAPAKAAVKRGDVALLEALAANPITAPYRFSTETRGGRIVLGGRVGNSGVHDAAVRTAIALGVPFSDQLIIDTAASYAVAARPGGAWGAGPPASVVSSYTYPPPIFGQYDEPFFGMEPPLSSFPPWWGAMSNLRLAQNQQAPPARPARAEAAPEAEQPLPPNTIEVTIDGQGNAVLRGVVPTDTDKFEIGRRLAKMPGVGRVINNLTLGPLTPTANPAPAGRRPLDDNPPPPPVPSDLKAPRDPVGPTGRSIRPDADPAPRPAAPARGGQIGPLARVERSIEDRPELAGQPIKVSVRDGVASLSGSVPSVYEAMLAFRAAQQTPGVASVVDTLRFVVPDGTARNPLLTKANPEDVEPYLEAQIRRQVGDAAHLDRVRLQGDQLQVVGTLEQADDRARVEAILRSMPILRGFKILPEFRPLRH